MSKNGNSRSKDCDDFSISSEDLQMLAQARASFCAFLGLHFMQLPDEDLICQARSAEFHDLLDALIQDENTHPEISLGAQQMSGFLEDTRQAPDEQLLETLGVDRTRLYRGVSPGYGPPPPYEAVWAAGVVKTSELLQEIAAVYQKNGLTTSSDTNERIDYVGIELAFFERLAQKEARNWAARDEQAAFQALEQQKDFLNHHLAVWTPKFVENALEHTKTDFYRGHLHMLRGFVEDQQEILVELTGRREGLLIDVQKDTLIPML
jgi:TorA maturation chaperone TorD